MRESPALTLSLSEVAALTQGAVRGSGRTWGEAEEAAKATVWLARAGLDWAAPLMSILDAAPGATPVPATGSWQGEGPLCPLRAGIAMADFAALPEGPGQGPVTLGDTLAPSLLLPFAARAAARLGHALVLRWPEVEAVIAPGAPPVISGRCDAARAPVVTLALAGTSPDVPDWPALPATQVRLADHARLQALALGTTVPTSARSQAGAGAAGGDDD